MLNIEEIFIQKMSERTEKESKTLSEETMRSRRKNDV